MTTALNFTTSMHQQASVPFLPVIWNQMRCPTFYLTVLVCFKPFCLTSLPLLSSTSSHLTVSSHARHSPPAPKTEAPLIELA